MKPHIVLDNDRVSVEKIVVQPGERIAAHTGTLDRLLVFLKGGVLRASDGRSIWWREGRVVWQGAHDERGCGAVAGINAGQAPIELIGVTLKPIERPMRRGSMNARGCSPLDYPRVPGEDLLENDRLMVQRFTVNPGQWEGVHAHHQNTLYIHIKGGQWAVRSKNEPEHIYDEASPDGEVGWMDVIDLSEGHESGNAGPEPIDLIWVSFKQ